MDNKEINEYIFLVGSEVWRVYGHTEQEAKLQFLKVCRNNSNTQNNEYKTYWTKLHNKVLEGDYISLKNEDFNGVRKIIG